VRETSPVKYLWRDARTLPRTTYHRVLAARAYVTVIKRAAMKIFAAEFTDLIFPLRIAVVGEGGRNEEQDQQETHWCLREGLQIVLRRGPAHRRQHRQAAGAAAQGLSEAFPVLLVAVVGAPDPIRGEIAEAFIVSRSGFPPGRSWPAKFRPSSVTGSPPTNILVPSSSSTACR
jgi:acyl-CoA synthetase (AMP-forming)/AMP-acid ligase II